MRLSDVLESLGRPVVYYPSLNAITGGTNATIFFCNFFQWSGQQKDPEGWIYKTQEEIEGETGLSRREQETARKQLKAADLLEEVKRGIPARLFYRIDRAALDGAWEQFLSDKDGGNVHPVYTESATLERANSTDYLLTEETAEKTQDTVSPTILRIRERDAKRAQMRKGRA